MIQIIEALKNNHIIDRQNVKAIKAYIHQKYPNDPADHTASIFADVIHKIIDNNIIHFDEPSRVSIKRNLLRGVSQKKEIEINAYEVFEVCTQLYEAGGDYIEHLTTWINHNQQEVVSVDEVTQLTTEVRKSLTNAPKTSLSDSMESIIITMDTKEIPEIDALTHINDITDRDEQPCINDILDIDALAYINDCEIDLVDTNNSIEKKESRYNPATEALITRLAQLNEDPLYFPSSITKSSDTSEGRMDFKAKNDLSLEMLKKRDIKYRPFKHIITKFKTRQKELLAVLLLFTGLLALNTSFEYFNHGKSQNITLAENYKVSNIPKPVDDVTNNLTTSQNHLPEHLQYQSINFESLRSWLIERDSALAEDPYFNCINETAKEYGINPLLLFAITGQEQGFVPKTNKDAAVIANNPFNVFGSWEDYNTDINESSRIAAITILNLSKDCPENEDMIKWINRKYAEDENWHVGVTKIFAQLEEATDLKD